MDPLVESVINLSEGRDVGLIDGFRRTVLRVPGCHLLDVHSDVDHNRSVFTLVGSPVAVFQGARELVAETVESIDLNRHRGVHPRIGAADVVPFIPLQGVSTGECIELAVRFAEWLAAELQVPSYLYGLAARRSDRTELFQIRKGQFEALSAEGSLTGYRQPDFGPPRIHPTAGATAVGVRHVLIAFNVFLEGAERVLIREIADRIRERDGGMPGVRALGLLLPDRKVAQISMNLNDFQRTNPLQALREVRRLAEEHGLRVLGSELVGLAPRAALPAQPVEELGLAGRVASPSLEDRIREIAGLEVAL